MLYQTLGASVRSMGKPKRVRMSPAVPSHIEPTAAPVPLVLLVDDDDDWRSTMTEIIGAKGYRIADFPNGRAALDYLLANKPRSCVLVTDFVMPEMDGQELVQALKEQPDLSTIPVLVVTGSHDVDMSGVMTARKPLDGNDLINAIARLVASVELAPHRSG